MTLQPLLQSSRAIQVHVFALALAWLAGTWQFFVSRKSGRRHAVLGRVFIALMLVTALDTLFIHVRSPGNPFFGLSLMHLYVPLILALCAIAIVGARTRRLPLHRFAVIAIYFGSLVFTGLVQIFLVPGIAHRIFFH
jgi:uncharacterized membrane protein